LKTKERTKDKVNIVTLGCAKNIVDSEVILTQLRGNQIDVEHESAKNDANIVIINTCGFIENAKQESIETILKYAEAKEQGLAVCRIDIKMIWLKKFQMLTTTSVLQT
jgi:ribosomal protein S12 methylthiotransferase